MAIRAFITAVDILNGIGRASYIELFDDENCGSIDEVHASDAVKSTIARAHATVSSFLPRIYSKFPQETAPASIVTGGDSIPVLLKDAELQWAIIYGYRRHKEYVKTYSAEPGGSLCKEALALMERIATAVQQIMPTDAPPEAAPANVGGKLAFPDPDDENVQWTDMGDW